MECVNGNGTKVMISRQQCQLHIASASALRGSSAFVQAWELRRLSIARWLRPSGLAQCGCGTKKSDRHSASIGIFEWPRVSRRSPILFDRLIGEMIGTPNDQAHFTPTICCFRGSTNIFSQEPFCMDIYRKSAGVNTSIEHQAFYSYHKNPFSVATHGNIWCSIHWYVDNWCFCKSISIQEPSAPGAKKWSSTSTERGRFAMICPWFLKLFNGGKIRDWSPIHHSAKLHLVQNWVFLLMIFTEPNDIFVRSLEVWLDLLVDWSVTSSICSCFAGLTMFD